MIPKKIVLENFLSFGQRVEINFDDEPLWVLCGPNGVGKSSVFDAIIYALFGSHRGGKNQGMDHLIHHGSNGFRIEFEFALGERDYRIIRNYTTRSNDHVYAKSGSDWIEVQLGSGRTKIPEWCERELGLTMEQFTASVLLLQGQADRLITDKSSERLKTLKAIIGVAKFEELADKVKEASRTKKARQAELDRQFVTTRQVTEDEIAVAEARCYQATLDQTEAQEREQTLRTRLDQAKQYSRLMREQADVERLMTAAADRQERAQVIAQGYQRWLSLSRTVPILQDLCSNQQLLANAEPELATHTSQAEQLTQSLEAIQRQRDDARSANEIATEQIRAYEQQLLTFKNQQSELTRQEQIARELQVIERILAQFPENLAVSVQLKDKEHQAATEDWQECQADLTRAKTQLEQKQQESIRFADVKIGAICSHCRRRVDADHAEREKQLLTAEIQKLRETVQAAEGRAASAKAVVTDRRQELTQLQEQRSTQQAKESQRLGLTRHATPSALEEIQALLTKTATDSQAVQQQLQEATDERQRLRLLLQQLEVTWQQHNCELSQVRTRQQEAERLILMVRTRIQSFAASLPTDWQARWSSLSAAELQTLAEELAQLERQNIEQEYQQLASDVALRQEWEQRRSNLRQEMAALPEESRVEVSQADQALNQAVQASRHSGNQVLAAQRERDALHSAFEQRQQLGNQVREAERQADLVEQLYKLLGKEGLLRDLVRQAERQIVRLANETLTKLSDGELSVELVKSEESSVDEAFDLQVRRGDSKPIQVAYLSGSQKFRVAVAVALAIGRYAMQGSQSKPLESVIIDEGFGSLDQDGLRCMAEELLRLKTSTGLKRIVLVSHQEEFVKSFPVGWQLSRSESGTVATPFRR